jgi:5-methylcytosine-specific restriction endonuclease McrA
MKVSTGETRYIQKKVKAKVWARDKGVCQNCGTNFALQMDHIEPFAMGGKSVEGNLRLLCRNCNQRRGQVVFNRFNFE